MKSKLTALTNLFGREKATTEIDYAQYITLLDELQLNDTQQVLNASTIRTVQYHGTCYNFERFKPFCHFGTIPAAMAAWRSKARLLHDIQFDQGQERNAAIILGNRPEPLNLSWGKRYTVALYLTNPLRIEDVKNRHNIGHIIASLQTVPHISKLQRKLLEENDRDKLILNIQKVALALGYDGLVYVNKSEDAGMQSYVNFFDNQVKIDCFELCYTRDGENNWRYNL